ncbi:MAG TPA: DNA-formamidopyrimidine glycosylase family protein [Anaeromyxobacteraceae bacterium]|nr:DNA-formamidopyrimidine glycosylase family protein [Anaeromyxobacteraceae bacterium]
MDLLNAAMPELPDIEVYAGALRARLLGQPLQSVRLGTPFLLRTADPPLAAALGRRVAAVRRLGKRLVLSLEADLHLAIHLMIAGRLHWREPGGTGPGRTGKALATLEFPRGTLLLTEAGSKRRAAIHLLRGEAALAALDRGGVEVLACALDDFRESLGRENHTLKRALTDPRLCSGIGNAYSDEILHRARLSPVALTGRLSDEEWARLFEAARAILSEWTERIRQQAGDGFPGKVTAFREGMAVHGRYRLPCPDCGTLVQRIRHAENETDYCPRCQTGGRILSDRALSRLLKEDWPRTVEEMERFEARRTSRREP